MQSNPATSLSPHLPPHPDPPLPASNACTQPSCEEEEELSCTAMYSGDALCVCVCVCLCEGVCVCV